jgi:ribonuclease P/MRP protein subunit RPP1
LPERGVAALKRVFADLHLRLNVKDMAGMSHAIEKAAALGYRLIGVPLAPEVRIEEVDRLRAVCREARVDFASRVDLRARSPNDLVRQLRRLRRKFEVICVCCESKVVARQAAKDRRVDLLSFPQMDYRRRFFDRAEGELALNGLAGLEVDVGRLLVLEGAARVRLLSWLRREVTVAKKFDVPVVVSSGVTGELLLRKPREMAALGFLFGLDEVSGLEAVSQNAWAIVKRNREKLGGGFVAPGIRVVKEGTDC